MVNVNCRWNRIQIGIIPFKFFISTFIYVKKIIITDYHTKGSCGVQRTV